MTALEYNKVMRLLQNREFPVDRAEFKVVATNAYQIGDDEFDAVVEAAAKRDLIGLEGDQIVEG
jgi:predicted nucleic-acid-binding protein